VEAIFVPGKEEQKTGWGEAQGNEATRNEQKKKGAKKEEAGAVVTSN